MNPCVYKMLPQHDLFRIHLKNFRATVRAHKRNNDIKLLDPTPWEWWAKGGYDEWLSDLWKTSNKDASATLIYNRYNYTKFCEMAFQIEVFLPHLLVELPQLSFLVAEMHSGVLEREFSLSVPVPAGVREPVHSKTPMNVNLDGLLHELRAV